MEAKELRVGNWLRFGVVPIKVEGIHQNTLPNGDTGKRDWHLYVSNFIESDRYYCVEPYKLEPISLTRTVLEECGFNLQPQRQSIFIKDRVKLWLGHNGVIAYLKHEDTDESYYIPNNPQSLHQLQNLYYSLMGTELIYNPTTKTNQP